MASIRFPDAPVLDEEFTDPSGHIWVWDGTRWTKKPGLSEATGISITDPNEVFDGESVDSALNELAVDVATALSVSEAAETTANDASDQVTSKFSSSGGTITGDVVLEKATPSLMLSDPTAETIDGRKWCLHIGPTGAVRLDLHDDNGTFVATAFEISRDNGVTFVPNVPLPTNKVVIPEPQNSEEAARLADVNAVDFRSGGIITNGDLTITDAVNGAVLKLHHPNESAHEFLNLAFLDGRFMVYQTNDLDQTVTTLLDIDLATNVADLSENVGGVKVPAPVTDDDAVRLIDLKNAGGSNVIWLPAEAFDYVAVGAPTTRLDPQESSVPVWEFGDTSQGIICASMLMPDWDDMDIFAWITTAVGSGDFILRHSVRTYTSGVVNDFDATHADTLFSISGAAYTMHRVPITDSLQIAALSYPGFNRVRFGRYPENPSDTASGSFFFYGLEFERKIT